jgi:hypothetical protein
VSVDDVRLELLSFDDDILEVEFIHGVKLDEILRKICPAKFLKTHLIGSFPPEFYFSSLTLDSSLRQRIFNKVFGLFQS